ncbi:MAG: ATP-binding protein [Gammaproteobacteria bacterium]|nr:ATP-binding protein [Gammaproteobacteria bacterium]
MKKPASLDYKSFRHKLDTTSLGFTTTSDLEPLAEFVGQERALEAINFGIGIKSQGYNLYAMGPSGTGKRSLVRLALEVKAIKQKTPNDWCYIHNFSSPDNPLAISLPAGMGSEFQHDIKLFIEEVSLNIISVFESDEYRSQMQEITDNFNGKREEYYKQLIENTPASKVPHLYKELHKKEKALQLKFTLAVIGPLIKKLKIKYLKFSVVIKYLMDVKKDLLEHINDFIKHDEKTSILSFATDSPLLIKYQVNLFVDNGKHQGAPVIFEDNPSYSNLVCRVEHVSVYGTSVTNFTLIRPGSLHRANGGYLVIEARKLKKEEPAWEGLKRALQARSITIEPIEQAESTKSVSLQPMPIPLDVKVIILGDRTTYYSLCNDDPDFTGLFKVAVDFDEQLDRNKKNMLLYARVIGTIARRDVTRPFNAKAVAALIEHSSRIVEDAEKLTTRLRSIEELIIESDYWASVNAKKVVGADEVEQAISSQIHRLDRSQQLYYEDIKRNFILINTSGVAIGQINCLSVIRAGNFTYGHPTRITAKVRMGRGKLIDIQREIKLAGAMHSKAGLIISNFLADRYNPDKFFSLTASLSFEQIYGMMDGDSASIAELCALLSALAKVPLKQYIAVTGSINQYGEAQAVGGVNDKIEGFYDVCKARGLTGTQGVIIPKINVKNLMLRNDIVESGRQKKFFIYTVDTIDDAISILTGMPAGVRKKNGEFPENSINYKVEQRLREYAINYYKKNK